MPEIQAGTLPWTILPWEFPVVSLEADGVFNKCRALVSFLSDGDFVNTSVSTFLGMPTSNRQSLE